MLNTSILIRENVTEVHLRYFCNVMRCPRQIYQVKRRTGHLCWGATQVKNDIWCWGVKGIRYKDVQGFAKVKKTATDSSRNHGMSCLVELMFLSMLCPQATRLFINMLLYSVVDDATSKYFRHSRNYVIEW